MTDWIKVFIAHLRSVDGRPQTEYGKQALGFRSLCVLFSASHLPAGDERSGNETVHTGCSVPGTTITASVIQQPSQGGPVWRWSRKS